MLAPASRIDSGSPTMRADAGDISTSAFHLTHELFL
jgi:hypothetical protein